jgi:hypothetical protein
MFWFAWFVAEVVLSDVARLRFNIVFKTFDNVVSHQFLVSYVVHAPATASALNAFPMVLRWLVVHNGVLPVKQITIQTNNCWQINNLLE